MSDNAAWGWTLSILAVGAAIFLLLLASPEVPVDSPDTQSTSVLQVLEVSQSLHTAYDVPLPVADAGSDLTLNQRETVRLAGKGYDPGGGALSYLWTAEGGRGYFDSADQPHSLYTAPSICSCMECIPLTLTVTNDRGASASDRLVVRVRGDPLICPPVPTRHVCGEAPYRCEMPCAPLTKVTNRCAPEPLPCERPCVLRVGPAEPCEPLLVPCCKPCDWYCAPCWPGEEAPQDPWPLSWSAKGSVSCQPASHPTPHISRHYPPSVDEGAAVQLHGRISNPACRSGCFSWKADKGWFDDPNSLNPIWHAPMSDRCGGEDACITLALVDDCGGRGYDQIRIHINNLDPWQTSSR